MAEDSPSTLILSQSTTSTSNQDITAQPLALSTEPSFSTLQPPPGFLRLLDELYPNGMEHMSSPDDWSNHTDWLHLDNAPEIDFDFALTDFTQLAEQLFPESLENFLHASNLNLPNHLTDQFMIGQPPWTAPLTQPIPPPAQIAADAPTQANSLPSAMSQHGSDLVYHQTLITEPYNASPLGGTDPLSNTPTPSE